MSGLERSCRLHLHDLPHSRGGGGAAGDGAPEFEDMVRNAAEHLRRAFRDPETGE
jgi:hypothetical protein